MTRFGTTLLCLLPALTVSAGAAELVGIEPGQWKVTSNTVMNGANTPPSVKGRCISPDLAGDVTKTFGPMSGTINSTCEPAEFEMAGRNMKWRLQCRGQLDVDVSGDFKFDTTSHYTATVVSKGRMGGQLVSDVKSEIEGERVGECQQ